MFGYRLCFVIVAGIFCISILVINFLRRKMHPHPGNMQEYRGNVLEHQGVCESKRYSFPVFLWIENIEAVVLILMTEVKE
ncbi:MAG: hypothetical protein GX115_17955 [Ruminiclostridium sp.]|nr:hypothetical protein [Ruminiclostridium sp.]